MKSVGMRNARMSSRIDCMTRKNTGRRRVEGAHGDGLGIEELAGGRVVDGPVCLVEMDRERWLVRLVLLQEKVGPFGDVVVDGRDRHRGGCSLKSVFVRVCRRRVLRDISPGLAFSLSLSPLILLCTSLATATVIYTAYIGHSCAHEATRVVAYKSVNVYSWHLLQD